MNYWLCFVLIGLGMSTISYMIGHTVATRKNISQLKELREVVNKISYLNNVAQMVTILKENEKDGCCGCHESREIFETSYKKLSNIPCKSEQEPMSSNVCESTCAEEEDGSGVSKAHDMGTSQVVGEDEIGRTELPKM